MRKILICAISILLVASAGCGKTSKKLAPKPSYQSLPLNIVAQVNEKSILKAAFDIKLRRAGSGGQNFDKIINQLIDEELIAKETKSSPPVHLPEEEKDRQVQKIVNTQKERIKANIQVGQNDIDAYLQKNETSKIYLLKIVLSDQKTAQTIISKLSQGAEFTAMAKQYSLERKIDLGVVQPGELDPEIETAAFKLKTFETSSVLSTGMDFQILKRVPLRKDFVISEIQSEKFDQAWKNWINELRSSAKIIINSKLFNENN